MFVLSVDLRIKPENVESFIAKAIERNSDELLLAEWLNALVLQMATRRMLFGRFAVRIDGTRLAAQAWGEPLDRERHQPAVEVKGATYTTLRVARHGEGWVAQTVVDVGGMALTAGAPATKNGNPSRPQAGTRRRAA